MQYRWTIRNRAVWLLAAGFLAAGGASADDRPPDVQSNAQRRQLPTERTRLEGKARQLNAARQRARRLREADALQRQVLNLYRQGKYREALQPAARLLEIRKRNLGEQHPSYATSLSNLAFLLYSVGEYRRAEPLFLQAREIQKKVLGERHPAYASNLNNLALLYESMGKYTKAELLFLQARDIRKKVLGKDHPDYATSLNNLAGLYQRMGAHSKAEPLFLRALDIDRRVLGEAHPDYASSLNNLAGLYYRMGKYTKAEPLFIKACDIQKKVLGKAHPAYADSLNNLAGLYKDMGAYSKAEPLYLEARDIRKRILGEAHPDYAASLNNIGSLYENMGKYTKAELLYLQTREFCKKVLGDQHPHYATILNNLAGLYSRMGEYTKAEPLYLEARDIWKKLLGEEHPSYAQNLNNLATLYESMGEYTKAEPLFLQAREILKKVLGEEHPGYTASLNNLAGLYSRMGEYRKAEPLYLQAGEIDKKVLGEEHPRYGKSLHNLAGLYLTMGEYRKSEPLFLKARDISKNVLGEEHPHYAGSLNNLALLYEMMGEYTKAEPLLRQSLQVKLQIAERTLPALSEAAAMAFLAEHQIGRDPLLSVLRRLPEEDRNDVYSTVWRTRALATRMLAERRRLLVESPEAEVVLQKLRAVRQQLAQLTLATPKPGQVEARRRQLSAFNDRKEAFERELAALSEPFRRSLEVRDAQITDLVALLPSDTAIIDIIRAAFWNPPSRGKGKLTADWHYEGFVLRRADNKAGYTARWVHLGRAEPIEQVAIRWLAQIRVGRSGTAQQGRSPQARLRELLWEPIESHLAGCSTLHLIPDGVLHYLPWSALPGRKPGTVLLEDYALATAVSGQQLYALLSEPASKADGLLVVGGIDYNTRGSRAATPLLASTDDGVRHRGPAREANQQVAWPFLKGTVTESAAIKEIWNRNAAAQLLQANVANERMLREQLPGSRYVHLATHGFFANEKFRSMFQLSDEQERLYGGQRDLVTAQRATVTARNPLILSGVVLAGANLPPLTNDLGLPTGDDGILTAEEVVNLNLRGTELVVLSACETGLGRTGGGEGIFGLQRAFHLAGARNVLASLWKVDDRATAAQMKLFYQKLWVEQKPPLQALREAQLHIYRNPDQISELARARGLGAIKRLATKGKLSQDEKAPVRHWAAFVLSGPGT